MDQWDFTCLPLEIAVKIIDKLALEDRKNLALVNRKCYEIISLVPDSKKLAIWLQEFQMNNPDHSKLKFTLLKKIICDNLILKFPKDAHLSIIEDEINFFVNNQSIIEITTLQVELPMSKEVLLLLDPLVAMGSSIEVYGDWANREHEMVDENMIDQEIFFTKHLHHNVIKYWIPMDVGVINKILKQWVNGERPKLNKIKCDVGDCAQQPTNEDYMDNIYNNIIKGLRKHCHRLTVDHETEDVVYHFYLKNKDLVFAKIFLSDMHFGFRIYDEDRSENDSSSDDE